MVFGSLKILHHEQGFTLVSILVALTILSLALIGLIPLYALTAEVSSTSRAKIVATNLGNREIEKIRALSYDDVGTTSGNPKGVISPDYDEEKDNIRFHIKTRVKWVDGDFDGVYPSDQDPRDYKQVYLTLSWEGAFASGNDVRIETYVSRESEEKVATGGNIEVTAKDTENNPIQDVRIDISTGPSSPIWDETDENGKVLFPLLDPSVSEGDYTIAAIRNGWVCRSDTANQTTTVIKNETRHLEFIMGKPGGLIVRLIDPLGNLVGKNSRITLSSPDSGTKEYSSHDGNFDISDLFPGQYDLTAWAASYSTTSAPITVEIQSYKKTEINVTLNPKPSGGLHVNVYGVSGSLIGSANISIKNTDTAENMETQTNNNGLLEIQLEEGNYSVEVAIAGYETQTFSIAVSASQNKVLDVFLKKANQYGSILVKCETIRNNQPIDNALIRVVGTGYDVSKQTGSSTSGEALFENLISGNYTVYRWRWGWRYPKQVTVVAGQQGRVVYQW